jgi:hypothetical protein
MAVVLEADEASGGWEGPDRDGWDVRLVDAADH